MENSNGFRSSNSNIIVEARRERYPRGCRVRLISMDNPNSKLMPGDMGTVEFVTDEGALFVNWDCGVSLVIYEVGQIRKVPEMSYAVNHYCNWTEKFDAIINRCIDAAQFFVSLSYIPSLRQMSQW